MAEGLAKIEEVMVNKSTKQTSVNDLAQPAEWLESNESTLITPAEFKDLVRSGPLHIDQRGHIRPMRREEGDPGVSLRKRRAWYGMKPMTKEDKKARVYTCLFCYAVLFLMTVWAGQLNVGVAVILGNTTMFILIYAFWLMGAFKEKNEQS